MKIIVKTKNFKLTPVLKDFIEKKLKGLRKFINILKREDEIGKTLAEVFIAVERETMHHKNGEIFLSKAEIRLPDRSLVVKTRGDNIGGAVVEIKKELEREIKKYKVKKSSVTRRIQRKTKKLKI